jgi:hypothetical protein
MNASCFPAARHGHSIAPDNLTTWKTFNPARESEKNCKALWLDACLEPEQAALPVIWNRCAKPAVESCIYTRKEPRQ